MSKSSRSQNQQHQRKVQMGGREIITHGLRAQFWNNIYFYAMNLSWRMFFLVVAGLFLCLNLSFATLYLLDNNAIANRSPDNFLGAFFFSVETLATVGYGGMHPKSVYGHWIATVELFVGMLGIALTTGIIFARFSRPRSSIIFAKHPVSHIEQGHRILMLRIANERINVISEATAKLRLIVDEHSVNTGYFRRVHDLKLAREQQPTFVLGWTLIHVIDKTSLLYGETAESLARVHATLILSVEGVDETTNQTQRARNTYPCESIRWNHRYVDIFSTDEESVRHMHYSRFHESEEIDSPSLDIVKE